MPPPNCSPSSETECRSVMASNVVVRLSVAWVSWATSPLVVSDPATPGPTNRELASHSIPCAASTTTTDKDAHDKNHHLLTSRTGNEDFEQEMA